MQGVIMVYAKNVPNWERVLRLVMGAVALAFAIANWGVSGLAVGVGIMGAVLAMTGLVGFCPMCALAGRKAGKAR
jgi:Protein of unknown function (DUF2892)